MLFNSAGPVGNSKKNYWGKLKLDGNVIVVDEPVEQGEKYNLSQEDLEWLANVALREQGSLEGAKMELSLMANLYEKNKANYSNVRDYVQNGGWFSHNSMTGEAPLKNMLMLLKRFWMKVICIFLLML